MPKQFKKIKEIAQQSRQWAEEYAKIDNNVFSSKLDCMCAISSSYLSFLLTKAGINNQIAIYEGIGFAHCFVITDNYLIDITATQFKYSFTSFDINNVEIKLLDQIDLEKNEYWEISKTFLNPHDLLKYQIHNGWPIEQRIDRDRTLSDLCLYTLPIKKFKMKL